jgi:uncharacterized protein (TIGR03435 family)
MRLFVWVAFLSAEAFGQPQEALPAFQAADVHTSPHAANPNMSGGIFRGGRYALRQANMVDLIRLAYGVEAENVQGGPSWLEEDRFDVIAKAPPATPQETIPKMLQILLADRFKLVIHNDTKPMPSFVLTVGKGKPKLKEAAGSAPAGCDMEPPKPPQGDVIPMIVVSCHGMTMKAFATTVHNMAGGYLTNPVVDATGLEGAWDFKIQWTGRGLLARAGADGLSIFDAVDKELGLKLEAQKYPTPVIVVDSVNEMPTPNAPGVTTSLPPPPPLEFEVAVLKQSVPGAPPRGGGIQPGGRIDLPGAPLIVLLRLAFDLQIGSGDEIAGAPKWVGSARYDVIAKASTLASGSTFDIDALRPMIQKLLADRLKLQYHYEDRLVNAYTLVADKPKLKRADPSNRTGCKLGPAPVTKDAFDGTTPFQAVCQNMTMGQFANRLQSIASLYLQQPVLDASGVEGAWDFTLTFSQVPASMLGPGGGAEIGRKGGGGGAPPPSAPAPAGVGVASEPSGGMSLFDAVEKQLGMKLEMHRRALPVFVIDHIEEKPVDN